MTEIYTVDFGTGTRIEFVRKPGETLYTQRIFIKWFDMDDWTEVDLTLMPHTCAPAKLEEIIEKSRAYGCKVTTPYDDDIAHEQNH